MANVRIRRKIVVSIRGYDFKTIDFLMDVSLMLKISQYLTKSVKILDLPVCGFESGLCFLNVGLVDSVSFG